MKQGTIKTLGAAALGAAIAVTAAGAASAASLPDTTGVLKNLPVKNLPVKDATKTLSGATQSKPVGGDIKTPLHSKGNSLLGGLPTNALGKTLG
ncbi:hypothetical protein ACF05W_09160 [Streptomyces lydicus]|uniref:hypothetical protein n=1 Tax=Streptomyces lydicus TaxID=47763 RepID=UPI0036FE44FC